MNLKEERKLWKRGYHLVAGLDEAGRGPLAGPVVAAALIIQQLPTFNDKLFRFLLKEVNDSKELTFKKREELYQALLRHPAIEWGVARVGPRVIERINILEATKLAMKRATRGLEKKLRFPDKFLDVGYPGQNLKPDFLLLDGNFKINLNIPQKSIIKADQKVFSCAAASIIAKVTRDRAMMSYDKKYPQYLFKRNKGYPTQHHGRMLKRYGPCEIHRKTFGSVKKVQSEKRKAKSNN